MSAANWLPFFVAWVVGWCLVARPRPLPPAPMNNADTMAEEAESNHSTVGVRSRQRAGVSIIVPARNEADSLPHLLDRLGPWQRSNDEIIVVDDRSSDGTASITQPYVQDFGVTLIRSRGPRHGWLGKPSACWLGKQNATRDTLIFLDADVRPAPDFVDRVEVALTDDACVSVLPWHMTVRVGEQVSLFPSIVALMGTGAFSVVQRTSRVAFGPVLAFRRAVYDAAGGHAAPTVRDAVVEDVALARLVPSVELYTGAGRAWWRRHEPASVSYRMYPRGARQAFEGWTRTLASGAAATSWWALLSSVAWVWAMASAPFIGWWAYGLAVVQIAVISRIVGRFRWWALLIYPVLLVIFLAMVIASIAQRLLGRPVAWKGRRIAQ